MFGNGEITNCVNSGVIQGVQYVGGICGDGGYADLAGKAIISKCKNTNNITGKCIVRWDCWMGP